MATTARKVVIGTVIAVLLALLISAAVIFSNAGHKPSDSWVAYNHGKHHHHHRHGKGHGKHRRFSSGDGFKDRGKDLPKFLGKALGPDTKVTTRTVSASMVAAAAKPTAVAGVYTVTAPAVAVCAPPPPAAPCTATTTTKVHHHHKRRHHKVKVTKTKRCCTSKTKSYKPRSTKTYKHRKAWKTSTRTHKVRTTSTKTKTRTRTKTATSCCTTKSHRHHAKAHKHRKIPDTVSSKDGKKKKKGNIFTRFAKKVKGIFKKKKKEDHKKHDKDYKKKKAGKKCAPCKKAKKVSTTTTKTHKHHTTTKTHHKVKATKTHKHKHHKKDHKLKKHHKKDHKLKKHHKKDHKLKKHHKKGHCDRKLPKSVAKEADKKKGFLAKIGHAIKKGFKKVKGIFKSKKDSKKAEKKRDKKAKKEHKKAHKKEHKKAKKEHKKAHKKCVPCKKAKKVASKDVTTKTAYAKDIKTHSDYKTKTTKSSYATATKAIGAEFDRAVKDAKSKAKVSTREFLRPDGSKVKLSTTVVDKMMHGDGKVPFNKIMVRFRCAPKIAKGEWHIIKGQSYKCVKASKEEAMERARHHSDDGLVLVVPPEQGGSDSYKICTKKAATAAVRN